jgi:phospholipid-binding lipoprotein MlaA
MKLLVILSSALLTGCAPSKQRPQSFSHTRDPGLKAITEKSEKDSRDPFEPWNRTIFAFNLAMNRTVFLPFIGFYRAMPTFFKKRVNGVLDTAETPISMVNCLLQGKIYDFMAHTSRLVFNVVLGLGGLFDVASALKIRPERQDFGKTLQKIARIPAGPYLIIPLLGPSSLRDFFGQSVDCSLIPATYWKKSAYVYYPLSYVSIETSLTSLQEDIAETFNDPYDALRDAYFTNRGDTTCKEPGAKSRNSSPVNSLEMDGDGDGDDDDNGGDLLADKEPTKDPHAPNTGDDDNGGDLLADKEG